MRSKAAIAGHPIHPALIALPIGGFVGSFVADLVYLLSGRDILWYDFAFWAAVFGVVTALLAAIPGVVDYLSVASRTGARSTAIGHAATNLIVVALFIATIALRFDGAAVDGSRHTIALILSLAGVSLLAVSGWLGGELVFRHHIGMEPDTAEDERDEDQRHRLRRVA
jgi:uncharacterized membrane protein